MSQANLLNQQTTNLPTQMSTNESSVNALPKNLGYLQSQLLVPKSFQRTMSVTSILTNNTYSQHEQIKSPIKNKEHFIKKIDMPTELMNGLIPNNTVEAQRVVETGFCSKFKTTHRHPSEKLMLSCKRTLGLKIPSDPLQNPSTPQNFKELQANQNENGKREDEIAKDISQSFASYTSDEEKSSKFESFDYKVDDNHYREQMQEQAYLNLLEKRYLPKKYTNDLRLPVPKMIPSKVVRKANSNPAFDTQDWSKTVGANQTDEQPKPLHLIALEQNRKTLLDILTNERHKDLRLKLTEEQIQAFKKDTFNEVKEIYLNQQKQVRQTQYKKIIMSRQSCDQVAREIRFLPQKQRDKLSYKLRWYVVNNINLDLDRQKNKKAGVNFNQELDQYFKENFGALK